MMAMLKVLLLIAAFIGYACSEESSTNDDSLECNAAVREFNGSVACSLGYESIVSPRDPNCSFTRQLLCEGVCAERAKRISCKCCDHDDGNLMINNIKIACGCGPNITCQMEDTCTCVESYMLFKQECNVNANSSSTHCPLLCNVKCQKLSRSVLSLCTGSRSEAQNIRSIYTSCKSCSSGMQDIPLHWIIMLLLAIAITTAS